MKSRQLLLIALAFPFIFAGSCKKKNGTEEIVVEQVVAPEVTLQVVAIQPDRAEPETAIDAQIFGQDFKDGARAWVGSTELGSVVVQDENTLVVKVPGLAPGPQDIRVLNTDGAEATLRGGLVVRKTVDDPTEGLACDKIIIHFELDKAKLDEESAKVLTEHMACFLHAPGDVKIEGHCDDRGTTDYNLALGQRRAESVEAWLVSQGVPSSRLRTISYGEERPLTDGGDEASWQLNRRGEIDAE
jgi:peptidoglycan-associated lipoprotein